jgi:alkylhydroperoxidase family enzyme
VAEEKSDPQPQWVRLLANFPKAGKGRVASLRAAEDKGTLDRRLRGQVAWIAARQDRAWYALGCARQRLEKDGVADKDVWALDGSWEGFTPGERAAFNLARKLTTTPDLVADADVAEVRKHYTDKQTAELVYQITVAAFFDRVTEAAGLRLER